MGIETMGPPPELVDALNRAFSLSTFVETGTLYGITTRWASTLFEQVYTIEASRDLLEAAKITFEGFPNIAAINGSSDTELHKLVPSLPPTMFFLDAHWSGGVTAGEKSECPLLSELAIIMPWFRKHVILIDDARLFTRPPPPPHVISEWPSLDEIIRVTQGAAYTAIYRDVIVMVPSFFRQKLASLLQALPY